MKELWKDITGYEDQYQISSFGNVFNKKWHRFLKQHINKSHKYFEVHLSKKQVRKHFTIHRLVAIHFVDNPMKKDFVNHKNCNKHDNYYKNLEWVTKSENGLHAGRNNLLSQKLRKRVNQYDMSMKFLKTWDSLTDAQNALSVFKSNISACCRGCDNSAGGYKWRFAE